MVNFAKWPSSCCLFFKNKHIQVKGFLLFASNKTKCKTTNRNNSSKAEKKSINLSIYWFSCFKIVKMIFWKNKQTNEKRICYKNPLEMKILCFQMFKCHNFLTIIIILNGTTIITLICGFLKINNTTLTSFTFVQFLIEEKSQGFQCEQKVFEKILQDFHVHNLHHDDDNSML